MKLLSRAANWALRAAGVESMWSIVRGMQPTDYQRNGQAVRLQGWERNAVVNACARAIVDIVASVDFEVCRTRADGRLEAIPNHDAAVLLNVEPRVGVTGYTHRAMTGLHYLLYGNSPWELERKRARGRVSGVRLIHPEQLLYVYLNADAQITRYDWRDALGEVHESVAEDVVHLKDLTASPDGLFGYPRAAAAITDIAADSEATEYVRQVVGNHGVPGMVVVTQVANKAELTAAEERFNERMSVRGERGRTVFVNGKEMQFEQIGFNLTELEFPDLRRVTREDICTSFNVDPRIVGISSASSDGGLSGVQYREARFRLIQQAVIPVMKAVESELNRWYMPEFGLGTIRFRPDTLAELTEDEAATSTRVIAEVGARIRTVEEARETVGLTADFDPKHHFGGTATLEVVAVALEQSALSPAEKAKAIAEAVPPALPPGSENGARGDGDTGDRAEESGDGPPRRSALVRGLIEGPTRLLLPPGAVEHRAMLVTEPERDAYWRAFATRAEDEEATFLRRIQDLFGSEWVRLAALFAGAVSTASLLDQLALLYAPTGPVAAAWAAQMRDPIRETLAAGARHTARQAPLGASAIPTAALTAAARRRAQEMAMEVVRTTLDQIRGLMAVAEAQQLVMRELADLVQGSVFGAGADYRASLIARTEIAAALNRGSHTAAVESRAFQSKHWVSQRDGLVRHSHRHAESEGWVWIEKAFGNGLQYPGDPAGDAGEIINCRCTVAYSHEPLSRLPGGLAT